MKTISAERIAQIEARRDELQAMMATGDLPSDRFVAVSKEYAELEPVAEAAAEVRRLRQAAASLAHMTEDEKQELFQQKVLECKQDHDLVVDLGGLHIIGTERHESRRIDNQLRGRAGRQVEVRLLVAREGNEGRPPLAAGPLEPLETRLERPLPAQ